jgi:hypothetical protein
MRDLNQALARAAGFCALRSKKSAWLITADMVAG